MKFNRSIRQFHRWMSIAFTLGFLINLFAGGGGEPPVWVYFLALVPLLLLLLTGLYLFVLPYTAKGRRERRAAEEA